MTANKYINNVDRFFLLMGIISDQIQENGNPDQIVHDRLLDVLEKLTPEERKSVQDRYFKEMIENDFRQWD